MAHPNGESITVKLSVSIPHQTYEVLKNMARFDGYSGEKALLLEILRDGIDNRWREKMEAREAAHFRKQCLKKS